MRTSWGAIALFFLFMMPALAFGQKVRAGGSVQSNNIITRNDEEVMIIAPERFYSNTYLDVYTTYSYFTAGGRLEFLQQPFPGFEQGFAGQGLANVYLTGRFEHLSVTLGDFYEQFGEGLIFRAYEDRALGIDNSVRGARVGIHPIPGINFKLLGGRQRNCFQRYLGADKRYDYTKRKDWMAGSDLEFDFASLIPAMAEKRVGLILGGSYVVKYDPIDTTRVETRNATNPVHAWASRLRFSIRDFSLQAEHAQLGADPTFFNQHLTQKGSALMVSTSYIGRQFSALLQARRTDNMHFRMQRLNRHEYTGMLNHLTPFTQQQTYTLQGIYPHATRPFGEWAYQLELRYAFTTLECPIARTTTSRRSPSRRQDTTYRLCSVAPVRVRAAREVPAELYPRSAGFL